MHDDVSSSIVLSLFEGLKPCFIRVYSCSVYMNLLLVNYPRKIVKGGPSQRLNELLSFHPMYTVQSIFIHFFNNTWKYDNFVSKTIYIMS